jgi:hypothetical protein
MSGNFHYFITFVKKIDLLNRWLSKPHIDLSSFNQHHMGVWGSSYEEDSIMSILPISKIYSPITIVKNYIDHLNVILGLPPKIFY